MTLSCAVLTWPELFQIISRIQGQDITDEEVDALSFEEKCKMLNLNPVIVAKLSKIELKHLLQKFF